ncbi:hypothetical protein A3F66_04100 [candidate division TM6 bacterium RIFCSPHIGHO2_12_FULL_32_22]|nr:MAG: hypothetical protein A3F66_04100 [candidate division TM6 bacterium RIFCSPHIGHO2_12_FULL_32_22]
MILNLITPFQKITKTVAWLEVDTTVGNFVIEPEHAPMILTLEKDSNVVFCLASGKREKVLVKSGIAHIKRDSVTILGDL